MRNQYVVEWSRKTNNLHIQRLESTLATNQTRLIDDTALNDYHINFVGSKEACYQFADNHRQRIKDRVARVVA